jgi:2-oxoisovalerate dehydrogenase E1 component
VADVVKQGTETGRLLIVDETRRTGGVSEGLLTAVLEEGFDGRMARVTAKDSFQPQGPAATSVLVTLERVVRAARALCEDR